MQNRTLAVDLMGRVAARRHDYVAAEGFHRRSANAGQENVRFNPSDLNSWVYWIRGNGELADAILEQGRVQESLDLRLATVALERRSATAFEPGTGDVAAVDAARGPAGQAGPAGRGQKSLKEAHPRLGGEHGRCAQGQPVLREYCRSCTSPGARGCRCTRAIRFRAGRGRQRTPRRTCAQLEIPEDDVPARGFQINILRFLLTTQGIADIRLGRYAAAEEASRSAPRCRPTGSAAQTPGTMFPAHA